MYFITTMRGSSGLWPPLQEFRPPRRSARHPSSSEEGSSVQILLLIQEGWRAERRGGYPRPGAIRASIQRPPPRSHGRGFRLSPFDRAMLRVVAQFLVAAD